MGKNEVEIRKNGEGIITVVGPHFHRFIDIRAKTGKEQFEAVRALILEEGLVFTEKIEKLARKKLEI
jgi:hypothetical protein